MDQQKPEFSAVAGYRIGPADERPDLLLVEIKTLEGPLKFAMPKSIALAMARSIAEAATKLMPDRSLS